jgi:hypothetical protein
LANGEIAINYADGRIYYLNANGSIASISGGGSSSYSFSTINVNSSLVLATSPTDILTLAGANGITVTACTSTKTITIGNDNTAALAYAKANAATLTVSNWYTGNVISGTISDVKFLNFNANSGISVSNTGNNSALITLGSSFKTWQVNGQTSLVAVGEDTVNFNAGNNIVITTNQSANPQEITFGTSANLTARYFIGDGSLLTGITSGGGSSSGYLANSIIFANASGYLSNTNNLQFFTSNNNFVVTGNVIGGGVRTTSSASAPASPTPGDIWYKTTNDKIYRYTYDGSNSYWIDINTPIFASNGTISIDPWVRDTANAIIGVNLTQNTNITFATGLAQAAFDKANTGTTGPTGNSFGVIYTANNNQYANSLTANAQVNFIGVAGVSVFANAITNTVTFAGSPGVQGLTVDYGFVYQTLDYTVDYGSI